MNVFLYLYFIFAGGNACKDKCRTPDSPESARAVAPRSPMSPQIHHSSLAPPPRPNRNSSSSPVVNGATTTPPPPPPSTAHVEQARLLGKIRKFLGSLVQLAQDVHPEASDRVRALVLSFGVSCHLVICYFFFLSTITEFHVLIHLTERRYIN